MRGNGNFDFDIFLLVHLFGLVLVEGRVWLYWVVRFIWFLRLTLEF